MRRSGICAAGSAIFPTCALDAWLATRGGPVRQCDDPPMVLDGWKAATLASKVHENVIAFHDLSARVTRRIWGPGPWLIWEYDLELDDHRRPSITAGRSGPDVANQVFAIMALTRDWDDWRSRLIDDARCPKNLLRVQAELLTRLREFDRVCLERKHWAAARSQETGAPGVIEPEEIALNPGTLVSALLVAALLHR